MSNTPALEQKAAIDGWFTIDDKPHLIGSQCTDCKTYFFPKKTGFCRNPACNSEEFDEVPLSRTGTIWSYTDAQYQPPAPYVSPEPFQPYAIAAVELDKEKMIVLGQLADGITVDDVKAGMQVELIVEPLFEKEGTTHMTWRWQPTAGSSHAAKGGA